MRTYIHLLRDNPDFARLWYAQVISLLGDWFNTIALSALVVAYNPQNPGLAIGALLLARFIPPAILSPIAGVLIDRFNRRTLLIWCNYLRALVVVAFLLATTGPQWLWLIYALSVAQFVLSSVFEPTQQAVTPALVKPEYLIGANTLASVTWSAMLAFGAAVGGVVAALVGTNFALVFDALTFVAAGLLSASIPASHFIRTRQGASAGAGEAHGDAQKVTFLDGVRYLRARPQTASTLLVKFGNSLGNVDTIMTIFATQIFVLGERGTLSLGISYSMFGVGAILGPLLLNRFNDGGVQRMRVLIGIGFGFAAVGWVVLGSAGSLAVVCLGLMIRAMGGSANWTYSTVIIQKTTDDSFLGRVSSWDWALFYLSVVVSTIVHGALLDVLGSERVRDVALLTLCVAVPMFVIWWGITSMLKRRQESAEPGGG